VSSPSYRAGLLTINPQLLNDSLAAHNSSSSSSWPSFPESFTKSGEETPIEMRICWLSAEEEAALLSGNRNMVTGSDSGIIFAESVPYLVDLGSGRRESIYLQHRKDIVRIQVIRRDVNNSGSNDAVVSGA